MRVGRKGRLFLRAMQGIEKFGVLEILQIHLGGFALHDAPHVVLHRLVLAFGDVTRSRVGQGREKRDQRRQSDPQQNGVPRLGARDTARRGSDAYSHGVHHALKQQQSQNGKNRAQNRRDDRTEHPSRAAAPH